MSVQNQQRDFERRKQHKKRLLLRKKNARTELTMFLCSTNSMCRAFESINRSLPSSTAKDVDGVVDASKAENGRQILCPWLSTSRTMMMMMMMMMKVMTRWWSDAFFMCSSARGEARRYVTLLLRGEIRRQNLECSF